MNVKRRSCLTACAVAALFGALAMAAQTLLLRRFLWRFAATESGVALFLACWLGWTGLGAAAAATRGGRRVAEALAGRLWLPPLAGVALYFVQYALIENLRAWLGVPDYQAFPLAALAAGCFVANFPFCFVSGFVLPAVAVRLACAGSPMSRAFAWEALGAALGGLAVTGLLALGIAPDPRDHAEWRRAFPDGAAPSGRFETGGGTTFYGRHRGSFYALSSSGVREVIPETDRAMGWAALLLSQRPYARAALLLGEVPLAVGLAMESLRPDLEIVWCPADPGYGAGLLQSVREAGVATRIRAAGATPRRYLSDPASPLFDAVLVRPPAATSLAGAVWREAEFLQAVRQVTRRSGVALFGLDCAGAVVTREQGVLLERFVRQIRQAWPESGTLAAGAGGWWVAAQVPGLTYGAGEAARRFALLKSARYPAAAVHQLYDPARAEAWRERWPAWLAAESPVFPPERSAPETTLAHGLADALCRTYPETAAGSVLLRLRQPAGVRLTAYLLLILWTVPVVAGGARTAPRRMVAAWLAACGALGLTASLAVLSRLEMRFGSLYLLAGAGSCLYLAGLFCGNRLAEGVVRAVPDRPVIAAALPPVVTALLAGCAFAMPAGAERAATASATLLLCFPIGIAAGGALPVAWACCGEGPENRAAVFVLADALGAAAAGVFFLALVPLAGLERAVGTFAALAAGFAVCLAAGGGRAARLSAGTALMLACAVCAAQWRELAQTRPDGLSGGGFRAAPAAPVAGRGTRTGEDGPRAAPPATGARLPGIPRKIDAARVLRQMAVGSLATNEAAYWERE